MLELRNVNKVYTTASTTTNALDDVSLEFRPNEFVAILGPSGSGKTTLLNVVGGLDTYDDGDMLLMDKSTKDFGPAEWDAYRNHSIGFVFQSYNLISHLNVIGNVELGLTLSNIDKEERLKRSEDALRKVGLEDQMYKQPNELSGGQMQRVAIARALATDPDILLCDEPTGALDSKTGRQVMDLIREVAEDKLVIMVTHDQELAEEYADRIVKFKDGRIVGDSHPFNNEETALPFNLGQTKLSYWAAFKLSWKNLITKLGQSALTSFASSIGIISIALVLALSYGFQLEINRTQTETMAQFPVTIGSVANDPQALLEMENRPEYPDTNEVVAVEDVSEQAIHYNEITPEFIEHIEGIDPSLANNIGYSRPVEFNLLREVDGEVQPVQFSNSDTSSENVVAAGQEAASTSTGVGVSSFPTDAEGNETDFLEQNYELLAGEYPTDPRQVVLIVDADNTTNIHALQNIGFDVEADEAINFDNIVGTEMRLIPNDDYYQELPEGSFVPNQDAQAMYDSDGSVTIEIAGILRAPADATMDLLSPGIAYSDGLNQLAVEMNQDSAIVQAQEDSQTNVFTNQPIEPAEQDMLVSTLGGSGRPNSIYIYPNDFESKEAILDYLDTYNEARDTEDQIVYTDLAGMMTELTGGLMDAITYALVAFAAISLITSMIMIGIITYTSVIQRTKEIGILKALGARKKDITRVFDTETFLLGVTSGLLGVIIAQLLTIPINTAIENLTGLADVAQLNPVHALTLVIVSTVLTVLGGHIPAKMAANLDAADALRSE